ncbi:MAG: nucleoside hydrolase [Actinomycetota bacterium]
MTDRPRLLLDCDPGGDDAFAIILALRHAEVLGITTVAGNVGLEHTTANALRLRDLLGVDVPVHAGADHPLVGPHIDAVEVHGGDGFGGCGLPAPSGPPDSADAIGFLIETIRANEGLWLVVTGPMTNAAVAIRAAPDLPDRLAGISFMGGSCGGGNATAAAEFNILADPEAAAAVMGCGVPLRMAGLDLTAQLPTDDDRLAEIEAIDTPVARSAAGLLRGFLDRIVELGAARVGHLHDSCAVLAVTHPELFTFDHLPVTVELAGTHTRGMTVVDQRPPLMTEPPNVHVGRTLDGEEAWRLTVDSLR